SKKAMLGLKQAAMSRVASTTPKRKSRVLTPSGIFVGSGSRPTHSNELFPRAAASNLSRKVAAVVVIAPTSWSSSSRSTDGPAHPDARQVGACISETLHRRLKRGRVAGSVTEDVLRLACGRCGGCLVHLEPRLAQDAQRVA